MSNRVDDDWYGVPHEQRAEWQRIYQTTQESLDISAPCPMCGDVALHRWYQIGKPIDRVIEGRKFVATGALWEWCSSCYSFEHYSCLVPDWWSCSLKVNANKLTALPTAIEEARKARASSCNPS